MGVTNSFFEKMHECELQQHWRSMRPWACYVKRLNSFCACVPTDKIRVAFNQSTEPLS